MAPPPRVFFFSRLLFSYSFTLFALITPTALEAQLLLPLVTESGTTDIEVHDVVKDSDNTLWAASEEGLFFSYVGDRLIPAGTDRRPLTNIVWTGKRLFAGGADGLFLIEDSNAPREARLWPKSAIIPKQMTVDSSGGVFVVGEKDELIYYKEDSANEGDEGVSTLNFYKHFESSYKILGSRQRGPVWASDGSVLLVFDTTKKKFVIVEGADDVGEVLALATANGSLEEGYLISKDPASKKFSIHRTQGHGVEGSYETNLEGRFDGYGLIRGDLWISIQGAPYIFKKRGRKYDLSKINLGAYGQHSIKFIEETKDGLLLAGEMGALRRPIKETDFSLVTHEGSFSNSLRTREFTLFWGKHGLYRFYPEITITVSYNTSFYLLKRNWILDNKSIRTKAARYSDLEGRDSLPPELLRMFEIARGSSREELEQKKKLSQNRGYRPIDEEYPPRERVFDLHASILDSYGNVIEPEPVPILMAANATFWMARIMILAIAALSILSWAPPLPVWLRYTAYSMLFMIFKFSPRIFQSLYLITTPWMKSAVTSLVGDLLLMRVHGRRCINRTFRARLLSIRRGRSTFLSNTAARALTWFGDCRLRDRRLRKKLLAIEEEERICLTDADCGNTSLEQIACEIATGIGRRRIPVVCYLEHLPATGGLDIESIIENKILSALEMEMWFLDDRFCCELLLRGRFIFVFRINIENRRAIAALKLFFENCGPDTRAVCVARPGGGHSTHAPGSRQDAPPGPLDSEERD